jgi:hypothetical protein
MLLTTAKTRIAQQPRKKRYMNNGEKQFLKWILFLGFDRFQCGDLKSILFNFFSELYHFSVFL